MEEDVEMFGWRGGKMELRESSNTNLFYWITLIKGIFRRLPDYENIW